MSLEVQKNLTNDIEANKLELIKSMYFKDSSDEEFQMFAHACRRTGLDPIFKQIHPVKRAGRMTIQTGIDGFRLIAERTGKYAPGKESTFILDSQGKLKSATAYVKKQTSDGTWHEVSATAHWDEYVQSYNGKPSQFWSKMPHTMLSKVAESICLRKAFPADLSGIYTNEEMQQADIEEKVAVVIEHVVEKKEDLTPEEVQIYLEKNWFHQITSFKIFMQEMMENKKWNNRKCIEAFEKHPKHTEETFYKWLSEKPTE